MNKDKLFKERAGAGRSLREKSIAHKSQDGRKKFLVKKLRDLQSSSTESKMVSGR